MYKKYSSAVYLESRNLVLTYKTPQRGADVYKQPDASANFEIFARKVEFVGDGGDQLQSGSQESTKNVI